MKLSRTGWNNVIIFSVMAIIILINATNNKLFPSEENDSNAEQLILPAHSVILTLSIQYPDSQHLLFERVGRLWQLTTHGIVLEISEQRIEQIIFSWQQSRGLVQAAEIIIDSAQGVTVDIALAGESELRAFTLYPLHDQLLIYQQRDNQWLALSAALAPQLLPTIL
ncbi:MAG: hypothetical protein V5789_05270 [Colwellia sp.]